MLPSSFSHCGRVTEKNLEEEDDDHCHFSQVHNRFVTLQEREKVVKTILRKGESGIDY